MVSDEAKNTGTLRKMPDGSGQGVDHLTDGGWENGPWLTKFISTINSAACASLSTHAQLEAGRGSANSIHFARRARA